MVSTQTYKKQISDFSFKKNYKRNVTFEEIYLLCQALESMGFDMRNLGELGQRYFDEKIQRMKKTEVKNVKGWIEKIENSINE